MSTASTRQQLTSTASSPSTVDPVNMSAGATVPAVGLSSLRGAGAVTAATRRCAASGGVAADCGHTGPAPGDRRTTSRRTTPRRSPHDKRPHDKAAARIAPRRLMTRGFFQKPPDSVSPIAADRAGVKHGGTRGIDHLGRHPQVQATVNAARVRSWPRRCAGCRCPATAPAEKDRRSYRVDNVHYVNLKAQRLYGEAGREPRASG
jgi:hypothetical protein